MKLIKSLFRILDKILSVLTIVFFTALILIVLLQITTRFTPLSFVWTEELTRYLFLYSIASAAGLAVVRNEYMGIDFILELFSEKWKAIYLRGTYLVIIGMNVVISYYAYEFVLLGQGQMTSTLGFHMGYIHLSIFFMSFFIMLFYVEKLLDKDVDLE